MNNRGSTVSRFLHQEKHLQLLNFISMRVLPIVISKFRLVPLCQVFTDPVTYH